MKIKTCGRETSNELVLEHASVSRLHARIELNADGRVSLNDADSKQGTYLNRNDTWIRIRKVTLCVGDRIRLGDLEVPLERLMAVFGQRANVRLEAKPAALGHTRNAAKSYSRQKTQGASLHKPRRNPVTGKIEEDHAD
jgi:pSer/pThr/pTyr-binding forkhead associated (FHA) protein